MNQPIGATEAADWETNQKYPWSSIPTLRAALNMTPASSLLKSQDHANKKSWQLLQIALKAPHQKPTLYGR